MWPLDSCGRTKQLVTIFLCLSSVSVLCSNHRWDLLMFIVHHTNMPLNSCFGSTMTKKNIESIQSFFQRFASYSSKSMIFFFLLLFIVVHLQSTACVFVFIQLHLAYEDIFGRASYSTPLNILIQIRQASRFIRV